MIERMDNVGIVFDDLEAAIEFFTALGLELEGKMTIDARWADRIVAIPDQVVDVAMMRTPDGQGKVELMQYQTPKAVGGNPKAPVNTRGYLRIMFAVDDIDDTVARVQALGATLVGELAQIEDAWRMCYVRGPEGVMVGLAQQLGK